MDRIDPREHAKRIRELNDRFRTTFQGGTVVLSLGVSALPADRRARLMQAVRSFSEFSKGDDPNHEHDFGAIELEGHTYFWTIDYYDQELVGWSEDPADPSKTARVLTIACAEAY